MCVPVCAGMHPHLHHCGCGCMGFLEVEEEIRMLESYKKKMENELEILNNRLARLKNRIETS